jgi:hypothetical protein
MQKLDTGPKSSYRSVESLNENPTCWSDCGLSTIELSDLGYRRRRIPARRFHAWKHFEQMDLQWCAGNHSELYTRTNAPNTFHKSVSRSEQLSSSITLKNDSQTSLSRLLLIGTQRNIPPTPQELPSVQGITDVNNSVYSLRYRIRIRGIQNSPNFAWSVFDSILRHDT